MRGDNMLKEKWWFREKAKEIGKEIDLTEKEDIFLLENKLYKMYLEGVNDMQKLIKKINK